MTPRTIIFQPNEKSFTLLELLIVIAVIAILAATVLVSLSGARQSAWEARGMQFSQNIKTTLADSLVGEWSFDDQTNPGRDDSGNNNNGTVYGATWTANGKVRGALSFDGDGDYVEILDNAGFNITQEGFTYEAWIKPSSFPNSYNMFMGHFLPYFNVLSSRKLHMSMNAGGAQRSVYGVTLLNVNTWYYVVATYDINGYMRVYLNGVQDGIAGPYLNPYNYGSNFYIGKWQNNSSYPFIGLIDEARIYKRALTAYEIKALYAEGKMRHLADK